MVQLLLFIPWFACSLCPCINEQLLFPDRNINWEWHSCFLVSACMSYCCAASDGSSTWSHHWTPKRMQVWEGKGCALDLSAELCLLFNICLYFCSSLLSLSNGVFDQKECAAKIRTYIYIYVYKCPFLLPAYIREKHLHKSRESKNN